jgi:predicted transcriptional regulator
MANDEEILSIDADDELIDYVSLNRFLKEDTERKKNHTVFEIEEMGDKFLEEIERKKKNKDLKKNKLIPYIINKSKEKYDIEELNSYSFEDVLKIYNDVKAENSIIKKIFHFIFNIE